MPQGNLDVVLRQRPEQIIIEVVAGLPALEAEVTVVEAIGPETVIWCMAVRPP